MARVLVLVVDDDEDVRELLDRQLSADGYDVMLATGFDDALAAVARATPDVLVTDFAMAPHTGEELLRAVAASYPAMGRILFTGGRDAEIRGARAAADVVLRKGCELAEVSASISRCLEIHRWG